MADRLEISIKAARRLALRGQLLAARTAAATLACVRHLGYMQVDSIAVVQNIGNLKALFQVILAPGQRP